MCRGAGGGQRARGHAGHPSSPRRGLELLEFGQRERGRRRPFVLAGRWLPALALPCAPPHPQHPRLAPIPPFLSLFFGGGGVGVWRPGKAPALCVVWDRGSGPLPFRCRRYAANSMGCSLITYLITEECQQCVCFGKGAGGCAGTTSHSAAHIKRLRRGGELGRPSLCPPPSLGRGRFLWPFGGGGWGGGCHPHPLLENKSLPRHVVAASAPTLLFLEVGVTGGQSWTLAVGWRCPRCG